MIENPHDRFLENIPAYVLGALSRAEASALKAHLEMCQTCQAELKAYQQIADGLGASVLPLQIPHPAIEQKLIKSIEAKAPRPKFRWGFQQFAFATITVVLIATNLIAFRQIQDLRQQQIQLASQIDKNHTILGMLTANTEVHPVSGDGFSGNLLLDRQKNLSYLLVWNLPVPPQDRVYQVWLVSPQGERVDAGSFRPDVERPFTSTPLLTSRSFAEFVGIEVTLEPLGGSDAPTGQPVMSVDY
jgi:anti-sigma-K factor RskA